MNYELIRSRRQTLSLSVDADGRIIVRAPLRMSDAKIDEFVRSKSDWIDKHTSKAVQRSSERLAKLSAPPSELPFLGEMCPVKNDQPYGYSDGSFHLPENATLDELRPYLKKLYASIARDTLISRTQLWADRMGVQISSVKVNSAKTRWGSCSAQRSINLSWKLIAADSKLIDYVIVHELCHTMHMNHSPAFWNAVEAVIPDYKERREAIKEVQKTIVKYGLE